MPDPDARLDALLRDFRDDLAAVGLPVRYLDATEGQGLPSLVIGVPPDEAGRERAVSLAFVPDGGDFEAVDLLQLYLPLEGAEAPADLAAINERSILGHIGVQSNGEVYYRVMWPVPKGMPIVPSVLIEVLQLLVAGSDMALSATTLKAGE